MHRVDKTQIHEILHDYKKACFLLEHESGLHEAVEREKKRLVDLILAQNFHYHFHKPPNPERAEVLSLIENYVREAVLPPVVGKLVERIVVLEKRQENGVRCLERLITLLAESST